MTWSKLLNREGVDITTISGIDLVFYKHTWKFAGNKEELFFTHFKDKTLTHYIAVDQLQLGRSLYKEYFNAPAQVERYYEDGKQLLAEVKRSTAIWREKLSKNQNNTETLAAAFNDFRSRFMVVCHIYSITSWLAIEAWQTDCEAKLSKLITKSKMDKEEQILNSIYAPWKNTALIDIQEKLANGAAPSELAKEYQFLRSWVAVWYRPLDESWIKGLKLSSEEKQKPLTGEEIITLLKPNAEEQQFITMAPYIIFFKDWRDDLRREVAYRWTFLFEAIAKRFEISYNDVGYLTLDEIEKALKTNKLDADVIKQKKNSECIITVETPELKIKTIDQHIPEKYRIVMQNVESKAQSSEVKGVVAQGGKATGKVVIVRSYHDIKKVQEGDILVANTTHPNYLPAMQKAAAFVTNEGGVVSHAAIVAREMKKPCIVGTKTATKLLQEGEFVEVDADKGTVKKL